MTAPRKPTTTYNSATEQWTGRTASLAAWPRGGDLDQPGAAVGWVRDSFDIARTCEFQFKQWRGLATRYDKLALTYRGGVVLRAITIWLRP